jgi:hypothetical protein
MPGDLEYGKTDIGFRLKRLIMMTPPPGPPAPMERGIHCIESHSMPMDEIIPTGTPEFRHPALRLFRPEIFELRVDVNAAFSLSL